MAGGVGSRFWPASREHLPKQFLDILGVGKSLIRLTFERAIKIVPTANIIIATNKQYKELVTEHLPELKDNQILLEPSRNNTAPCIAYAALKVKAFNPNGVMAVLPSDHVILKEDTFLENLTLAFDEATKNNAILTLGIEPTRPDTGYGYIEIDTKHTDGKVRKVAQFKEKPNVETAKQYLQSGNFVWNAGIFIWSVETILSSFGENAPGILKLLAEKETVYNTFDEQAYIDKVYPLTENISVDYAILEKSQNVYTIPVDIGWSDLGTWNSLYSYLEKDDNQNVLNGKVTTSNTTNTFVKSSNNKLLVIDGLDDYIIIDEEDVLLIYPKHKEQEIKQVRKSINDANFL